MIPAGFRSDTQTPAVRPSCAPLGAVETSNRAAGLTPAGRSVGEAGGPAGTSGDRAGMEAADPLTLCVEPCPVTDQLVAFGFPAITAEALAECGYGLSRVEVAAVIG